MAALPNGQVTLQQLLAMLSQQPDAPGMQSSVEGMSGSFNPTPAALTPQMLQQILSASATGGPSAIANGGQQTGRAQLPPGALNPDGSYAPGYEGYAMMRGSPAGLLSPSVSTPMPGMQTSIEDVGMTPPGQMDPAMLQQMLSQLGYAPQKGSTDWGTEGSYIDKRREGEKDWHIRYDKNGEALGEWGQFPDEPVGKEFVTIDGKEYARLGPQAADYRKLGHQITENSQYGPLVPKAIYDEERRKYLANKPSGFANMANAFGSTIGLAMGAAGLAGSLSGAGGMLSGFAPEGGYQSLFSSLGQNAASQGGGWADILNAFGGGGSTPDVLGGLATDSNPWGVNIRNMFPEMNPDNIADLEQFFTDLGPKTTAGAFSVPRAAGGLSLASLLSGGGAAGSLAGVGATTDQDDSEMGTAMQELFASNGGDIASLLAGLPGLTGNSLGSILTKLLSSGPNGLLGGLGTLGATGLGAFGAMDQTDAIKEANEKNAAAFKAAQDRAMSTLTEAQKLALQSSGAGRDEAVKAFQAALDKAVKSNESGLASSIASMTQGRDVAAGAYKSGLASSLQNNSEALASTEGALTQGRDAATQTYADSLRSALANNDTSLASSLRTMGEGRDRSAQTLNDFLSQSLGQNQTGLNAGLQNIASSRDASLAMSNRARDGALGALDTARTGALGSNQATEDKYFGVGDQYRDLLEASYRPDFKTSNIAGYDDAVNSSMNASMRALSTGGNPYGNPGGLMEAQKYVTQNTALPAIQNYRAQLGQFGNQGMDTAGAAALQRPGIHSAFGVANADLLKNFGQFDATLNSNAGNNMANANINAGQFGANLTNSTGSNLANLFSSTGNNMANAQLNSGQLGTNLINQSGNNVAALNDRTGANIANARQQSGLTGTNLISQQGNNLANLFSQTGTNIGNMQNQSGQFGANLQSNAGKTLADLLSSNGRADADLIARLGQTGATVLGQSYNSVPTSNAGMFNALGYGLNSLTNPQTSLQQLLAQLTR